MAKSEYDKWLGAPNPIVAAGIAIEAHARVFGVFNPLIEDKKIPLAARKELKATSDLFANKTTLRFPQDPKK